MIEDATPVVIGGKTYLCPPMPFYCLERAWPHIQKLGQLGAYTQSLAAAELLVRVASTPAEHDAATQAVATANALIEMEGADFVGQTRVALQIIVAALALDVPPPSYDGLSRVMQADEIAGVHVACARIMDGSGLTRGAGLGELTAPPTAALSNGAASSLN